MIDRDLYTNVPYRSQARHLPYRACDPLHLTIIASTILIRRRPYLHRMHIPLRTATMQSIVGNQITRKSNIHPTQCHHHRSCQLSRFQVEDLGVRSDIAWMVSRLRNWHVGKSNSRSSVPASQALAAQHRNLGRVV